MQISAALAAELSTLSEALDQPGADIAETLQQLAADAKLAVRSYVGLSIRLATSGRHVTFTALEDGVEPTEIVTSLRLSLPPDTKARTNSKATMILILYAARPGAFTDLAADLSWLTGAHNGGFALDLDLTVPFEPAVPSGLRTLSTINQAIGFLIGRGNTPRQAHRRIDTFAARAGIDRTAAAEAILATVDERT